MCYCKYQQNNWDELLIAAEFTYSSSVVESLGTSPFELDLGWKPKSPLDCLLRNVSITQNVNDFRFCLKIAYEDAQFAQEQAKARSAAYNSRNYTPIVGPYNTQMDYISYLGTISERFLDVGDSRNS